MNAIARLTQMAVLGERAAAELVWTVPNINWREDVAAVDALYQAAKRLPIPPKWRGATGGWHQEPLPAWVKAREREKAALLREKAEHARAEAAEAALADTRQALAEIEALALRDGSGVISIARRALAAADGNTP